MITVSILGLDQYVVGHYSGEVSQRLAKLYETSNDDIMFYAPDSFLFHDGVEQTSWNVLVRVSAPLKFKRLQDVVAKFIIGTLESVAIHIAVEFTYFKDEDHYEKINREYPRFITDENLVYADKTIEEMEDEEEPEIYEGNVFADLDKKLSEAGKTKQPVPPEHHHNDDKKACCADDAACACHGEGKEKGCADDADCDCHHDEKGECCGGEHAPEKPVERAPQKPKKK